MKTKDKRNYLRRNTLLPFKAHRLDVGREDIPQCRVSLGHIVIQDFIPPETEDERLNAWLNMINSKLDYLISGDPRRAEESLSMSFEPLNISAGGMEMVMNDEFHVGDILEIRMALYTYPSKILYLYGKIIRIEQTTLGPETKTAAIKFSNMNDEVRNEIMKFDFKKHVRKMTGKTKIR